MTASDRPEPIAWQPLTFSGVAAFSQARFSRLALVQGLVALIVAVFVARYFAAAWAPMVDAAIQSLSVQGAIRQGQLAWPGPAPTRLADSPHLTILVDLSSSLSTGDAGDWVVIFKPKELCATSILGAWCLAYGPDWDVNLNRDELDPWWGARRPFILGGIGLAAGLAALASWYGLGLIYLAPAKLLAFLMDRRITWGGGWRVAQAALMPGALWVCGALALYQMRKLELAGFLAAYLLHFAVGWIYLAGALCHLPLRTGALAPAANPFAPRAPEIQTEKTGETTPPSDRKISE